MAASTSRMEGKLPRIFEFKITLLGPKPKVWRRVQVPDTFNFWDLHVTIQDAMGWEDYHLHKFEIKNPKTGYCETIGVPMSGYDFDEFKTTHEKFTKISDYFKAVNDSAKYQYDFGIGWDHSIVLEKILPAVPGTQYPICTAGKTACPAEDGNDPESGEEDYEKPAKFDPKSVKFDNSEKRWKSACYN